MKIEKYGATLIRLTHDKIEQARNWRNDPKITQYMEYKEYITPEMQEKWFRRIDNVNNYYFIIVYDSKEIGLINIRDIDYDKKEGEAGIYIYDDDYLNSDISFRSSLCLYNFCFETINMDRIIVHILKDNKRAIQYNKMLGFILQPEQENIENQLYHLEKSTYYKKRDLIIRLF